MAILILCQNCRSTGTLKSKKCKSCGTPFGKVRKYRVLVKQRGAPTLSRVVESLSLAREVEAAFKGRSVRRDVGLPDKADETPTMTTAWKALERHLKAQGIKEVGYYEKFWRVHVSPALGGKKLAEITPGELDDFSIALSEKNGLPRKGSNEKRGKLAPSTVANILKLVKRIYKHAIETGMYRGKNLGDGIVLPKYDNRVTNSLDYEAMGRALKVLREWPNRMAALGLLLCLATGKRGGEVFGLRWDDIDRDSAQMRFVVKSKLKEETHWLPMNETAQVVLEEAFEYKHSKSDLVFHTKTGKKIYYYVPWARIRKKARIEKKVRPHDLRHTFASMLASSGKVDIYTLQNLLGHKSIQMTKRYARLMDTAMRRGIAVADDMLSGKPIEKVFRGAMPGEDEIAEATANDGEGTILQ